MKEILERYKALTLQRRDLMEQAGQLQKELDAMEPELERLAIEMGLSSFPLESGGRIQLSDKTSVRTTDKAALRQAVIEAGLEDILSVNANTLASVVRERAEQGLPPLAGVEMKPYTVVSFVKS